jgi:LPXTG-motif cell wall-anchored protein
MPFLKNLPFDFLHLFATSSIMKKYWKPVFLTLILYFPYFMRILWLFVLAILQATLLVSAESGTTTPAAPTADIATSTNLVLSKAPTVTNATDTTIDLAWEPLVNPGIKYIVRYATKSVAESKDANAQYDDETDPITGTGVTLTKLQPNTTYYMSVVILQADARESDMYSPEVSVKTSGSASGSSGATTASQALAITSVDVKDSRTLIVSFTAPLSQDPVSVNIKKTSDNSALSVESVKLDTIPTAVIVTLASDLSVDTSYTLVVQSAKDTNGKNIEAGINGEKSFPTPKVFANVQLNAAPVSVAAASATGMTQSGANAGSGAMAAQELPGTGAKENIMLLAALILTALGFALYRRKQSV